MLIRWASAHGINGTTHKGELDEKKRPGITYPQYCRQRDAARIARLTQATAAASAIAAVSKATHRAAEEIDSKTSVKPIIKASERQHSGFTRQKHTIASREGKSSSQAVPANVTTRNDAAVSEADPVDRIRGGKSSSQSVHDTASARKEIVALKTNKDYGTLDGKKDSAHTVPAKVATRNDAAASKANIDDRIRDGKSTAQTGFVEVDSSKGNGWALSAKKAPSKIDEQLDSDDYDEKIDEDDDEDQSEDDDDDDEDDDNINDEGCDEDYSDAHDADSEDGSSNECVKTNVSKKVVKAAAKVVLKSSDADERADLLERATAEKEAHSVKEIRARAEISRKTEENEAELSQLKNSKEKVDELKRKAQHFERSVEV